MPFNSGFHFSLLQGSHRNPEKGKKENGTARFILQPSVIGRSRIALLDALPGDTTTMWSTRMRIVRPEHFHLAGNSTTVAGMEK